jgi:DNA-binding transcriptional LysR family regulator
MDKSDWTLTRSFLAVAETGSLSAAARHLHLSQPTLGRHIADLEVALGLPLFTRAPRGLVPTDAALDLLPHAQAMRDAAARMHLAAAGRDAALSGPVRLTASRIVAHYLLPPMLAALRRAEPGIEIDLVPSDSSENLLFREADIALRMYRPTQLDVITQHLCDLPTAIYAASGYLDHRGRPTSIAGLADHDVIGFDRSDMIVDLLRPMGITMTRADFPVRCDDQIVYWNLVRAGCGIGGMQCLIGDADPGVERAAPFLPLPSLPVWLTTPQVLRQSARIRRVHSFLAAAFRALPLDPPRPTR